MAKDQKFRYTVPTTPPGEPITAEDLEDILRAKVEEHPEGSPERLDAHWQLARFLGMVGRPAEGLGLLEVMLKETRDPETRAEVTLGMGQLMERLHDFPGAVEAYTRGVSLEPVGNRTWYFLHNNLGYSLNQLGRHSEGEPWCRRAIEIGPERYNAHKNLGVALEGLGRYGEAARCYVAAVRAEAADPRALAHLESLVAAHPAVLDEVDDLEEDLEACRTAVARARKAWA